MVLMLAEHHSVAVLYSERQNYLQSPCFRSVGAVREPPLPIRFLGNWSLGTTPAHSFAARQTLSDRMDDLTHWATLTSFMASHPVPSSRTYPGTNSALLCLVSLFDVLLRLTGA
jgi:hypothetical protein